MCLAGEVDGSLHCSDPGGVWTASVWRWMTIPGPLLLHQTEKLPVEMSHRADELAELLTFCSMAVIRPLGSEVL